MQDYVKNFALCFIPIVIYFKISKSAGMLYNGVREVNK
jgi:hypothetical protein